MLAVLSSISNEKNTTCNFIPIPAIWRAFVAVFVLTASLQAQDNLPKYSVVKSERGDAYISRVNQLADQGYRVLVVNKYTILRLDATPPNTYRYVRLKVEGGPAQFSNWVNEQGAHGYRWVANTELLEKAPHPKNYEYRNSPHGASRPSNAYELSAVISEGYHPLGEAVFQHTIGSPTSEMYFEREVSHNPATSRQVALPAIEVADAMRIGSLMKRVDALANQGYRFLSPHYSNRGGGMAVILEKCPDDCDGRYEYRYFDAKNGPQVERELNKLGTDGFRVVPISLAERPHLLERDNREKQTFSYRALEESDASSLQQSLNSADPQGYVPIGFVWHSAWTAQLFVVLEKDTMVSPAP